MTRDRDVESYLIRVLCEAKDDSLERAEVFFRGRTPDQMAEQYGQSSHTCQEILDGYRAERWQWKKAVAYLQALIDGVPD